MKARLSAIQRLVAGTIRLPFQAGRLNISGPGADGVMVTFPSFVKLARLLVRGPANI